MRPQDEFEAMLAKAREFAPSVVGLDLDAAVRQVGEKGYRAQVIPTSAEAVTADLNSRRIRLFVDENDVVARATAG